MSFNFDTTSGSGLVERIPYSLRFDGSGSHLTKTFAGTPTSHTTSVWVKRGRLGTAQNIIGSRAGASTDGTLTFNSSDQLVAILANTYVITTTAVFRDPSAWYHIVLSVVASGTAYLYVNNVQVGSVAVGASPWLFNSSNTNAIGRYGSSATQYFDGYLSRICFIDGAAKTPSDFGFTDAGSNQWVSKSVKQCKAVVDAGGTNSFMLEFENGTDLTTLGNDYSAKNNDWTLNFFTRSAGVSDCWMTDTPTNNYCTFTPLNSHSTMAISNGGLNVSSGATPWRSAYTSIGTDMQGKWYAEFTCTALTTSNYGMVGLQRASIANALLANYIGAGAGVAYQSNGDLWYLGSTHVGAITAWTVGTTMGFAVDCAAKTVAIYKGGTLLTTITGITNLDTEPWLFAAAFDEAGDAGYFNFGQRSFAYTPPTGYKALCTANLPTPAIPNPKLHFDVAKWSGNNGTQDITVNGIGSSLVVAPDLVWEKCTNVARSHRLVDSVRGINSALFSDSTASQQSSSSVSAFLSNGFTAYNNPTNSDLYNATGETYVAWLWKAGGTAVTNTAGSITSQVSANTTAGFSIVTYRGNDGATATVGHGLGVAPKMIIVKRRNQVGTNGWDNWGVYHVSLGNTQVLWLQRTDAAFTSATAWNNTTPTSTYFTIANSAGGGFNDDPTDYVAYCFAEVPGFSKFGSYTGNGNADGPFVYCGFKPKFVLLKSATQASTNWIVFDTARSTYNQVNDHLGPNTSSAENFQLNESIDVVATGFKVRNINNDINASTHTIIYAAFAEAPFNYANAR